MTSAGHKVEFCVVLVALMAVVGAPALASVHDWVINEIYSDVSGNVQFIEMRSPSPTEIQIGGKSVSTNANVSDPFPGNVSPPTKYLLLGTAGFAALSGAPPVDLTIPSNFFNINGDTIKWHTYTASILSFGPGDLPTDGVRSLDRFGNTVSATPTNFDLDTWAHPHGPIGLEIGKIGPTGGRLALSWDTQSCLGHVEHHIVFGSTLPANLGDSYTVGGSKCDIGFTPYDWLLPCPPLRRCR